MDVSWPRRERGARQDEVVGQQLLAGRAKSGGKQMDTKLSQYSCCRHTSDLLFLASAKQLPSLSSSLAHRNIPGTVKRRTPQRPQARAQVELKSSCLFLDSHFNWKLLLLLLLQRVSAQASTVHGTIVTAAAAGGRFFPRFRFPLAGLGHVGERALAPLRLPQLLPCLSACVRRLLLSVGSPTSLF